MRLLVLVTTADLIAAVAGIERERERERDRERERVSAKLSCSVGPTCRKMESSYPKETRIDICLNFKSFRWIRIEL